MSPSDAEYQIIILKLISISSLFGNTATNSTFKRDFLKLFFFKVLIKLQLLTSSLQGVPLICDERSSLPKMRHGTAQSLTEDILDDLIEN